MRVPRHLNLIDLLMAVWIAVWIALAIAVHEEVRGLDRLSDTVTTVGHAVVETAGALESASDLPVVGGELGAPAEQIREAGESAVRSGRSSRDSVEALSILLALALAVLPSVPVVGFYLPLRAAIVRDARSVTALVGASGGLTPELEELLARRAVQTLPYRKLAKITDDPLGDLAAGRFRELAAAELERLGVSARRRKG